MSEARHTIKRTHIEGVKLDSPETWCGEHNDVFSWAFCDANHLALSVGGSIAPCKACIDAIILELKTETQKQVNKLEKYL